MLLLNNQEEERSGDPLIRDCDLDAVTARIPADLLKRSQQEHARMHTHTPSSSQQSPTPTPEAHAQGGEKDVHALTL